MDYSLYLTVEKVEKMDKDLQTRNRIYSEDGSEMYHIGVIDYLQEWNANKIGEHYCKVFCTKKDGKKISCVEPEYYRERFGDFMQTEVFTVPCSEPEA